MWGCHAPAEVRNYCRRCYEKLWKHNDITIVNNTGRNRKIGKCPKCKQKLPLVRSTGHCQKCDAHLRHQTPEYKATHQKYYEAHREDYTRRSRESWRRNSKKKNKAIHDRKMARDEILTKGDAMSIRWRRPEWFYCDDQYSRIAWSFTFDKEP